MKRLIVAVSALFIMATVAMAQNDKEQGGKRFDKTEMIQKHTDKMIAKYGLDANQAKALLALNQEYADKMPMMGGGHRGGHGPNFSKDDKSADQQREQTERQRPSDDMIKARMQEMKENIDAYNGKLKSIMNESQYVRYQEDMKQRMQLGPHGDKMEKNNNSDQK